LLVLAGVPQGISEITQRISNAKPVPKCFVDRKAFLKARYGHNIVALRSRQLASSIVESRAYCAITFVFTRDEAFKPFAPFAQVSPSPPKLEECTRQSSSCFDSTLI